MILEITKDNIEKLKNSFLSPEIVLKEWDPDSIIG